MGSNPTLSAILFSTTYIDRVLIRVLALLVESRSVVSVYVRHRLSCSHLSKGEFYRGCSCPKWLRYSIGGKQHRKSADTRTWSVAEENAAELQAQLDTGKSAHIIVKREQPTIAASIETFISGKTSEGLSKATIRKLKFQLGQFERFITDRSKYFPAEITTTDVIEYRTTWDAWQSGVTRQKAQQNLRGFLRSCCKANLPDLLRALKTIKLSKVDRERLKPQPFTEKELTHLLAQVPKTFPNEERARKMTAFIHCAVSTGLAIRDTVQLERASLRDGWLRIERQKTGRAVRQRLDDALRDELFSVANGNPKYIFWNGESAPTTATGQWQADLKQLMQDAGVWIRGNLSHRFRDTAVDFWLGEGCSMTEVAAMLGDTVAVCEKHYADLASKRMEDRLSKMPTRSWSRDV
ncbi:MAG: hypothetical protein WB616_00475 [Candidatus Sulfotelmatobacter sp.]